MRAFLLPHERAFLRYLDFPGRAPAIVHLHCLAGASAGYLETILAAPLAGRRTLLIDLLGFGCSDRPASFAYGLADHADSVARLLDQLGVRGAVIIGHSMGGSVAITLAARRPDLVAGLIVAEPPLRLGEESASRAIAAQGEAAFVATGYAAFLAEIDAEARAGDAAMAAFLGLARQAAPHALYRTAAGMVRETPTLRDRLCALPLPRAYIWGARTLATAEASAIAADLAAGGVENVVIPDAGHHPHLDNPGAYAAALADVLARWERGDRGTDASLRSA